MSQNSYSTFSQSNYLGKEVGIAFNEIPFFPLFDNYIKKSINQEM